MGIKWWGWVQNILPRHPLVPQSQCKFWPPPAVQKVFHLVNYRPSLAATPLYSVGWPLVRISIPVQHGRPSLCGGCNTSAGRRVLHHLTLRRAVERKLTLETAAAALTD